MSVYFGLLIFCVISSMIGRGLTINRFDIRAKIVDVLPFLALFVVSAFRYQVGKDYGIYVGTYDLIKTGQQARIDIFTYWVMKVMASLNLDVQYFFIVSSFIVNYLIYLAVRDQSNMWDFIFCLNEHSSPDDECCYVLLFIEICRKQ